VTELQPQAALALAAPTHPMLQNPSCSSASFNSSREAITGLTMTSAPTDAVTGAPTAADLPNRIFASLLYREITRASGQVELLRPQFPPLRRERNATANDLVSGASIEVAPLLASNG